MQTADIVILMMGTLQILPTPFRYEGSKVRWTEPSNRTTSMRICSYGVHLLVHNTPAAVADMRNILCINVQRIYVRLSLSTPTVVAICIGFSECEVFFDGLLFKQYIHETRYQGHHWD
jgi:hypothetical protein